ncbi:MAG TPA: glycoside hydrolase family 38 C-terminal domain-containing protein [Armatimonadota bacterium]|nr:glycoside hydrolase family 38 C-terminal domain-containing protein [Armatimonadota bacterium]
MRYCLSVPLTLFSLAATILAPVALIAAPKKKPAPAPKPADPVVAATTQAVADWLKATPAAGSGVLENWKFHEGDLPNGGAMSVDDSSWKTLKVGDEWGAANEVAWFRREVVVPTMLAGAPVAGQKLILELSVDDDGVAYVNGKEAQAFHWDGGRVILTNHAVPGTKYLVAVKDINGPGTGRLFNADLTIPGLETPRSAAQDYLDSELMTAIVKSKRPDLSNGLSEKETKAAHEINTAALATAKPSTVRSEFHRAINDLSDPAIHRLQDSLVGYAHTDIDWLWQWPETKATWYHDGMTILQLMSEYPDLHFSQTQMTLYRAMKHEHPDLFKGIQAAVKAGLWEPLNGWCENDMNMPSGESEIRQAMLSNLWSQKNLGVTSSICWRPDSFGHAWTLPMILKSCGVDYYYFCRAGHGVPIFWWQSPDGSRILAFNETAWYNASITPATPAFILAQTSRVHEPEWMTVYGVGDHGGGPTRADINEAIHLNSLPAMPRLTFSTAADAFARIVKAAPPGGYPVISDENNPVFQGCYTSHVDTKRYNRELEHTLYSAEAWSSVAALMGRPYPVHTLHLAWYDTLRNQFHDIMAGSNIHPSYLYADSRDVIALGRANGVRDGALGTLDQMVNTAGGAGVPVIVYNPLGWQRTDVVRAKIASTLLPPGDFEARASSGGAHYGIGTDAGNGQTQVEFVADSVPAVGYRVFWLQPASAPSMSKPAAGTLENALFRVTYDPAKGVVTSIYDKTHHRELIRPGGAADQMQILWEGGGSAWDLGPIQSTTNADLAKPPTVETLPDGTESLVITNTYDKSTLVHRLTLRPGIPRVDFSLDTDWQEQHTKTGSAFLKTAFDTSMTPSQAWWEIPFGAISRPENGQEEVGLKWIDVDQVSRNVSQEPLTPVDLSTAFTGTAFSTAANPAKGSFDDQGMSYPTDIIPHPGTETIDGVPYIVPDPSHSRNQVVASGQTIKLPANQGGDLYLLGAASNGGVSDTISVHFADGKTVPAPVSLSDWVTNDLGETAAFTGTGRFVPTGPAGGAPNIWAVRVPVNRSGEISSITLPTNPHFHLFALTVGPRVTERPEFGVALLNNGRYGSDIKDGVMRMSVIRSAGNPDPIFDVGHHFLRYALYPHDGGWQSSDVARQGWDLNTPLEAQVAPAHPGTLPASGSFMSVDGKGIVMTALKQSEDQNALIVRFYNDSANPTEAAVHFALPRPVAHAWLADMKETLGQRLDLHGQNLTVPVRPWSVVTLRLGF